MKNPKEQYIDKDSVEKLEKLGFERRTNWGEPMDKLSCGYIGQKNRTGIHLFPLFESSGDHSLYFEYFSGNIKIESVDHLKKLISALKH